MMDCRLADVAKVDSGAGFPLQYQGTQNATFPFLKVSDMNLEGNEREIQRWNNSVSDEVRGKLRAKAFPAGSLIFPKIGAAIGTNKKRQLTQPSCVDNNVMAVIPKAELLEPDFLYFLFLAKNISDFASDSNPPSIRKSEVENWQVRVPTLSEQRRIVDILSRAAGIVRLRREAERKAAELVPGIFLDMFGDPATNPKGWPVASIGRLTSVQTGATPSRENPAYYLDAEIPWVKTGEVKGEIISETEEMISQKALSETNCKVFPVGTILVAMYGQGQTRGRAAVLGIPAATNQACAAILPSINIDGSFLFCFLQTQYEQLRGMAHGGNQANLNLSMIKSLPIILPPLSTQKVFSEKLDSVRSIQSQQAAATAKAEATFASLLAWVFSSKENL
ncbi:MAG: restriction endonuclease subunit S [Sulfuricella sp.]|nr:restriction endonuclease subunit S [Sulfuricella sp.]